jgi:hypothetical protein
MIRPLTIATFLMACGSGLYIYQTKHESQVLDRTIEKTVRDTAAYREQSRLLAAEWTMLNDPETLRRYADTYLSLKTIAPSQFTSLADLDNRLPSVQAPPSPPGTTDEPPVVVATAPAAPSQVEAVVADDAARTPSRAASRVVAAPTVTTTARTTDPAPQDRKPTHVATADAPSKIAAAATRPPPPVAVATTETRSAEQRQVERRPAETRTAEAKVADVREPAPARPTVVATAQRAVIAAPAPTPLYPPVSHPAAPVAAQPSYSGGSLLGMARNTGASPSPRPTPVNATQWSNTN